MSERFDKGSDPDTPGELGEVLMHPDEARAIFQTELMRQVLRRGIAVENLQPRMIPALIEANTDAMLAVLAENNHRIVDLLYQMGLINITTEGDDEAAEGAS
ncbi:MAG TPA: hypothetical protein VFW96_16370 [Thermomicrobiales bacterium]|nr:hypothetical protein [Thermomicrobiales bacterium]